MNFEEKAEAYAEEHMQHIHLPHWTPEKLGVLRSAVKLAWMKGSIARREEMEAQRTVA